MFVCFFFCTYITLFKIAVFKTEKKLFGVNLVKKLVFFFHFLEKWITKNLCFFMSNSCSFLCIRLPPIAKATSTPAVLVLFSISLFNVENKQKKSKKIKKKRERSRTIILTLICIFFFFFFFFCRKSDDVLHGRYAFTYKYINIDTNIDKYIYICDIYIYLYLYI